MPRILSILALTVVVLGSTVFGGEIKLQNVPGVVVAAVRKAVPGAKLVGAETKNEDDSIELVYRITLDRKGMKTTVEAWPRGEIIKIEKEITPKELPKSVNKTLSSRYPKAKIRSSVLVKEYGKEKPLYDLGITFKDVDYQIQIANDGTVEQSEKSVDVAKLPKPVTKAVSDKYPDAKIKGVVERWAEGQVLYVVDVSTDGKDAFKMQVDRAGEVLEDQRADAAKSPGP